MTELAGPRTVTGHRQRTALNPAQWRWGIAATLISAVSLMPIVALAIIALMPAENIWPHLVANVLPVAVRTSIGLMAGVGLITLLVGTSTAWLVTMCRFPGRAMFEWLLLAPLAMPTYITAYCYVEVFDYAGPLQSSLRYLFGWENAAAYWFPEIRSLGGAIFVMAIVLYPYVYLTARASFLAQSVCLLDVSRTLGRSARATFFSIALPLARPALIAGVTLALMETINDIGAVEFFGVRTLTFSVYSTWLGRGNLSGAAQLAGVLFVFVFALIWIERRSRQHQRFHLTSSKYQPLPAYRLGRIAGLAASLACALPIVLGMFIPFAVLLRYALPRMDALTASSYLTYAGNSIFLSLAAAVLAVSAALLLVYARKLIRARWMHNLTWLASIGYAIPGTVLAIGVLIPLAAFDNGLDGWMRNMFGISTGLVLSGTSIAIILTYTIRFLAVAHGSIDAGMGKLSPHLAMASRTLGRSAGRTLLQVQLPLIRPALVAAGLLVFVDGMKELPATILLRPFNFETLATHVYSYASLERFEDAAIAALTIVMVGLIPVILLNRAARMAFRPGKQDLPGAP